MIMKKLLLFLIPCSLFLVPLHAAQYRARLVADMDTGHVIYSENANELLYPASLTKIMTLYLTFDALEHGRLRMDDQLIVSQSAASASPVKLGLRAGSKLMVEDAIKALAVYSANDVARVLAENLKGGKEGSFASLMTQVATEIGLSRTNFENASGLPNDDQQSTARDIALLSMAIYKHFPQHWKYFSIKSWTYNGKTYANGNRLLGSYPGCDGMKTGYTNKSKYSLVRTAKRDGKRMIAVILGAENKDVRAATAIKMLDKGFGTKAKISNITSPATTKSVSQPITLSSGTAGVQFGAFSSRGAAAAQQIKVENALTVDTSVEETDNGMFRVRVNGLSESVAQRIKNQAASNNIDCYVFH
jgi:D-alanyl-D-alanine carboxypeptidase